MTFVKHVWPEFIEGKHHKEIADKFNDIANKKIKVNKLNSIFFNLEGKKFSDLIIPSDLTYIRY